MPDSRRRGRVGGRSGAAGLARTGRVDPLTGTADRVDGSGSATARTAHRDQARGDRDEVYQEHSHLLALIGELAMLGVNRPTAVALIALTMATSAACGTQSAAPEAAEPATGRSEPPAIAAVENLGDCAEAAKDPEVLGDATAVALLRKADTTLGDLNQWLERRASDGAPLTNTGSYQGMNDLPDSAPMTVCVFETEPRPIPIPEEATTVANGIRVFVQGPGAYAIDAIGDRDRLTEQLDTLTMPD